MRLALGTAGLAVVALLAGCGSTVPMSSVTGRGAAGGELVTGGSTGGALAPGGLPGQQPIAGTGASGNNAGTITSPQGSTVRSATTSGHASLGTPVPGRAPIEVGIPYLDPGQTNELTSGIGTGLASADARKLYEDYMAKVNSEGGVLGHKVVGAYYKMDPNTPLPQLEQEVCTYFTQDHRVRFVFVQDVSTTLLACLSRAGVALLADGIGAESSTRGLAPYSLVLMPQTVTLDRLAKIEVPRLMADGYLTGSGKLGVLYFSNVPASVDGLNALKSELAAHHLHVTDAVGITKASGSSDIGSMEASVQSAELKFRAEGIDHVMCEEGTPWICGFFPIYANSQSYYPRYAFNSSETLTALVDNDSARSLQDAVAITWFPASDLQEQAKMPPRTRACLAFFQSKGIDMSTGNEKDQAMTTCEDLSYLKAALEHAPSLTAQGLIAGAQRLGLSYPAIGTFGTLATPTQRDGVALISEASYVAACTCFRYTKAPSRA